MLLEQKKVITLIVIKGGVYRKHFIITHTYLYISSRKVFSITRSFSGLRKRIFFL